MTDTLKQFIEITFTKIASKTIIYFEIDRNLMKTPYFNIRSYAMTQQSKPSNL